MIINRIPLSNTNQHIEFYSKLTNRFYDKIKMQQTKI